MSNDTTFLYLKFIVILKCFNVKFGLISEITVDCLNDVRSETSTF